MAERAKERIQTGSVVVDGVATFFRRIPGEGAPAVFVHGVPSHSEDWTPFLERMPGPAIAFDLPGFGRSERPPPERFDYAVRTYAAFVERLLEQLGVAEYTLVVHDWGSLALIGAQRQPERLRRLCALNAVPLLPGYRWHRTARSWRTRGVGELTTRLWSRRVLALGLRESRGDWSAHDDEFIEAIWQHLDRGTLDAILRLYRSAPEDELERLGRDLGRIEAPALVVWGLKDRYLPARFGRAYAEALPNSELVELREVGHWPWLEDPSLIDRVVGFVEADG